MVNSSLETSVQLLIRAQGHVEVVHDLIRIGRLERTTRTEDDVFPRTLANRVSRGAGAEADEVAVETLEQRNELEFRQEL